MESRTEDLLRDLPDFNLELEFWKGVYASEKNPLAIWEAIKYCCSSELEFSDRRFPDWVMEYLLRVSLSFLGIDAPGKRADQQIKEILEFRDARLFSRHKRHEELKRELYALAKEAASSEERGLLLRELDSSTSKEYIEAIEGSADGGHPIVEKLRMLAEDKGVSYEIARRLYYIALEQAKSDCYEESKLLKDSQQV